jgi:hypothetical protein
MAQGGRGLNTRARAARRRQAIAAAERDTRAARLGASLRSVLVSPASGFSDYVKEVESRPGRGRAGAVLLGGLLGASLWLLWQKVNGLLQLRESGCPFRWHYLVGVVVLGALLGMLCEVIWARIATFAARRMGGQGTPSRFRLVWGAASVPHAAVLLVLLPLDLLLVGTDSYRAVETEATGGSIWRALSVAFSLALVAWSLWLLFRGSRAIGKVSTGHAAWLSALAVVSLAIPVAILIVAGSGAPACRI